MGVSPLLAGACAKNPVEGGTAGAGAGGCCCCAAQASPSSVLLSGEPS